MLTTICGKLRIQPNIWTCRHHGRLKYTYTKVRDLKKISAGEEIQVKVMNTIRADLRHLIENIYTVVVVFQGMGK